MNKNLSKEQVEAIKNQLREDPEIRRLAKTLGVTVDRFLEDIERQGSEVQLHDATTPAERAATDAEILRAAERSYADAREQEAQLSGRKDRREASEAAAREACVVRSLGVAGNKKAPTEVGSGAVIAPKTKDAQRIAEQVRAGRLATRLK